MKLITKNSYFYRQQLLANLRNQGIYSLYTARFLTPIDSLYFPTLKTNFDYIFKHASENIESHIIWQYVREQIK